jgi:hypothetical protein
VSPDESVLLWVLVEDSCGVAAGPTAGIAVAALADVGLATVSSALAALVGDASREAWLLGPADAGPTCPAWPAAATLRGLGVIDGTHVVLRRAAPHGLSGARS